MQPMTNIAMSAARAASDIIIRHMDQLDRITISQKHNLEYFSEVDVKAEQAIIRTIRKAYPDHSIIAEESGLHEGYNNDAVWIIDPLDGTNNYLHGFPFFSVSIAFQYKNVLEHAVIVDPIRHEFYHASKGRGAFMNDRRLRVSKQTVCQESLIGTGFQTKNKAQAMQFLPTLEALFGECAGIRRTGSAALDLAYVAAGRLDGFFEFGLRPWDIAAGCLLIKEAGGMIADPYGKEDYLNSGNIIGGNPKIFRALMQLIQPTLGK